MTTETAQTVIDELDNLLDREREALLSGDIDRIMRILELKETLIDRINGMTASERGTLDEVRGKLSRNQVLLASAMDGIRAVANRMADLRRVRNSLETYDRAGHRTRQATPSHGTVEKRA